MTSTPLPTQTPNVHIENPNVRKALRTVLDVIGGLTFIATMVDIASPAFDVAAFTVPILQGYAAARVVFGFAVDNPNTPTFQTSEHGK
jgi:hypothetical protein